MPVSIGFHPYFQLTDSKRHEWTISVGARRQWLLDERKIPTGETVPIEQLFRTRRLCPCGTSTSTMSSGTSSGTSWAGP